MTKTIYNLVFVASFVVSLSACTTTARMVSREVSVSPAIQIEEAQAAIRKKDYTLAAKLLEPLANQGRGDAQYALGYLYFNGMGVPKNNSIAAKWFKVSADNGNENAKLALSHIPPTKGAVIDIRDKNKPLSDSMPVMGDEAGSSEHDGSQLVDNSIPPHEIVTRSPVEDSMIAESNLNQSVQIEEKTTDKLQDVDTIASGDKLTDGEKWIARQPSKNFTIQLIVLADESALQSFISDNNLQGNAVYYQTEKNGKIFHALVHGSFESYSLAKEAVEGLSSELKQVEPWIRNISNIQNILLSR